jgi:hypothetical protein
MPPNKIILRNADEVIYGETDDVQSDAVIIMLFLFKLLHEG